MEPNMAEIEIRKRLGYWYLGSPYSKYPRGHQKAFEDVAAIAGYLMQHGWWIFCPITHSHPIVEHAGSADTYENWIGLDQILLRNAIGLIVAGLEGWKESRGLIQEIRWALEMGQRVLFFDPSTNDIHPMDTSWLDS